MVVVVIFLNIIFGIIIDTFAELRDQRQKVEEDTRRRRRPMLGIQPYDTPN